MRYERKYSTNTVDLSQLKEWILSQSGHFKTHYSERTIHNIYYDTAYLDCYEQNIRECSDRIKYRIRWYGDFKAFQTPKLELKIKKGLVNYKKTYALDNIKLKHCIHPSQDWKKTLPTNTLDSIADLEPTLINRYKRHYFISYDKNIRLTLDTQLSFQAALNPQKFTLNHLHIIELKYDIHHSAQASSLIGEAPFRLSKLSKYVMGMQLLSRKGLTNWTLS